MDFSARNRIYFYLFELFLLGAGVVIGDLLGWVIIGFALVAAVITAALGGDLWFIPSVSGRISMSKATALMFNRASSATKKFVAGNSTIDVYKRPENYFALVLMARGRKRELMIWGRRSKSLALEELSPTDLALGLAIDGDQLISMSQPSQPPSWIDLKVKRADALATLKQYENKMKA